MQNIYSAQLNNLEQIERDVASFCIAECISANDQFAINLSIDEMFTNVVTYGYKMNSSAQVEISLTRKNDIAEIVIVDTAPKFDPTEQASSPDITSDVENRAVGGLGVFFVKKQMHKISYEYRDNKNIVTMIRNLSK